MYAKQYLSQLKTLDVKIKQRQEELCRLRAAAERITPSAEGSPGGYGGSDRVGSSVARIMDLQEEIAEQTYRLCIQRDIVISQLHRLEDTRYMQILYMRYVEYKSLEQIAVELNYSYDRVRHLHGYALIAFGRQAAQDDTQ